MISHGNNPNGDDHQDENPGGLGAGVPSETHATHAIQSEKAVARIEGRALKWDIKQEWREAILKRQVSVAIDPSNTPRDSARAARFVLDADKYEDERHRQQGPHTLIQAVGEVRVVTDGNFYGNADRLPPDAS